LVGEVVFAEVVFGVEYIAVLPLSVEAEFVSDKPPPSKMS
jgi:hypothetical protein